MRNVFYYWSQYPHGSNRKLMLGWRGDGVMLDRFSDIPARGWDTKLMRVQGRKLHKEALHLRISGALISLWFKQQWVAVQE